MAAVDPRQREHSVSRWRIYRGCPFAYKTIILDKVPRVGAMQPMIDGALLHEMAAAYLERLVATSQAYDQEWAENNVPPEASFRVRQIWRSWSSGFVMPAAAERIGIEQRIALDRNFGFCKDFFRAPGLFFRLVIDFSFVQGEDLTVVRDWKSNMITVDSPLDDEQMSIYGWVKGKQTGTEEILLSLESLALGYRREALVLRKDLDFVPDMIRDMADKVENTKKWPPTPGSFCAQCGVAFRCPEMEKALIPAEFIAPATSEDALKAASLLLLLDNLRSQLGDQLKAWTAENGSITVGDMVYGAIPTSEPIWNPEKLVDRLLAAGVPRTKVWEAVTVTKTNLSRILKSKEVKRKDLLEEILDESEKKLGAMVKFTKVNNGKAAAVSAEGGAIAKVLAKKGAQPSLLASAATGDSELDSILNNAPKK